MEQLKSYIQAIVPFPDEELEVILSAFQAESLRKGAYFYREGQICGKVAFIRSGFLRSYYLIEGQEFTRFLLKKNSFATALSSFIRQQPSEENIQAVTDCSLYTLSWTQNEAFYRQYPRWQELGRKLIENYHLKLEERVLRLVTNSAEERYRKLEAEHPDLLHHVPLGYIASLLGVNQATLSRIRRKRKL